jgi:hypothetical protein
MVGDLILRMDEWGAMRMRTQIVEDDALANLTSRKVVLQTLVLLGCLQAMLLGGCAKQRLGY